MEIPAVVPSLASKLPTTSINDTTGIEDEAPTTARLILSPEIDSTFRFTTNLASALLNTTILACSDDYFAAASNLLNSGPPVHRPGVFVHTGAWYDGWETRRHNPEPYDWVVIKLGAPGGGRLEGVEVDTAYFVGNYGERAALQGFSALSATGSGGGEIPSDEEIASPDFKGWQTILPPQRCGPSQRQAWKLSSDGDDAKKVYTHFRLLMYPDGGFARLRLYGHAIPPPPPPVSAAAANEVKDEEQEEEELSSALIGALALSASDQHYTLCSNLLLPGRGKDMGDGWETARSRAPGHVDWAIIRLGLPGRISRIVVDTKDFRGNFPRAVRVHGLAKSVMEVASEFDAKYEGEDILTPRPEGKSASAAVGALAHALGGENQDQPQQKESTMHTATEHLKEIIGLSSHNKNQESVETEETSKALPPASLDDNNPGPDHPGWISLLRDDMNCKADTEHTFQGGDLLPSTRSTEGGASDKAGGQIFTHVKLTLIPDGGVKRLRIFGKREIV